MENNNKLTVIPKSKLPALISSLGQKAEISFYDFFFSIISNENTRQAYKRALVKFFSWCGEHRLNLTEIKPFHIGLYRDQISETFSKATLKQHISAIRKFFDFMTERHHFEVSPASSIRTPKHNPKIGKTSVLSPKEIRQILNAIPLETEVDYRDRAIIGFMVYTFARVSAVANLEIGDLFFENQKWNVRLKEKGDVELNIPLHHQLQEYLLDYLQYVGMSLDNDKDSPLFRAAKKNKYPKFLQDKPMTRTDMFRMVKRRAKKAGVLTNVCDHSFRASGITIYIENGGTITEAQKIAGHADARTTKLYDRTNQEVKLAEIERIRI